MAIGVRNGRVAKTLVGAALAVAVTGGGMGVAASAALADTTAVTLSANVTATGTPGITSGAGFNPASVAPGGTTTMGMGTTQPANICRTTTAGCPDGYPNWVADLTITGLQAAGLTFTGNGDTSAGCVQTTADEVVCHYPYFNNYHKSDNFYFTVASGATPGDYAINVNLDVHAKTPTTLADCKKGGWTSYSTPIFTGGDTPTSFDPMFKNQGDCVSFVATSGK
jgi:hypothetical protein